MSLTTTPPATTLLEFIPSLLPDPPQMGQSLRLRFSATRRPASSVYCQKIRIVYGVDGSCNDPSALTCKTDTITPTVIPDGDWNGSSPQSGVYLFRPKVPGGEVTKGYTLEIADIAVSSVLGPATVTVTETATDHDKADCPNPDHSACFQDRVATFIVPKFPADFGEVVFKPSRSIVSPGGSVTLTWEGDKSGIYELSAADQPVDAKRIDSSYGTGGRGAWTFTTDPLNEDTPFTLSVAPATEPDLKREYYLAILVGQPRLELGVKGNTMTILEGDSVRLTWHIAHYSDCQIKIRGDDDPVHRIGTETDWDATPTETSQYYLTGVSDANQELDESSEVEIEVVPQMQSVTPDLVFIKTATTGNVEIQVSDGKNGFQQSFYTEETCFEAAEGPNGTWQIAPYTAMDPPALLLIRTRTTRPGVEVWVDYRHAGASMPPWQLMSSFRQNLGPQGTWQAFPMNPAPADFVPDLVFIQTANPDQVEVQYTQYRHDFAQSDGVPMATYPTCYRATNPPLGTYLMADMGSHGRPADLVFIQTAKTSSKQVELSYATGASGYQQQSTPWVTDFKTVDAAKGTWLLADMDGDGRPDLVFVKTIGTASGRIEVYYARAADGYKKPSSDGPLLGGYTMFDVAEGPNGTWQVVPYPLGRWVSKGN